MHLQNLKDSSDHTSFREAVKKGLGKNQGLYFPNSFTPLPDCQAVLDLPFVERSTQVLKHLIGDELSEQQVGDIVADAFTFPAPLVEINERVRCLELFHGPTLAFKDFGGRFMAQCLSRFSANQPITILTATSGDTGAAVAHAFHRMPGVDVVILFPKGKISPLQEKLFTTLGDNIHTFAVDGDFDHCQALVKQSFDDPDVRDGLHLNSANSINISRLLAQVCYYFEAIAQLPNPFEQQTVVAVPSGNFGNLTAGIIGKLLGLPIKRFVAATNSNDTVPRYLSSGEWAPHATKATMSNAMDVSQPNNWPRIQAILDRNELAADGIIGVGVDEESTQIAMHQLAKQGYTSEPHAAVAYTALEHQLEEGETGIFLGTAHPAKFRETVENVLGQPLVLPKPLIESSAKKSLAVDLKNDYSALKHTLFELLG